MNLAECGSWRTFRSSLFSRLLVPPSPGLPTKAVWLLHTMRFDAVVCGAGLAGIATARHLAIKGLSVCLVDCNSALSMTSSRSTECYRLLWPTVGHAALAARSLALMQDCKDVFGVDARQQAQGYLFVGCHDPCGAATTGTLGTIVNGGRPWPLSAIEDEITYTEPELRTVDVHRSQASLKQAFPWLCGAKSGVFARDAGWINAHSLGSGLLDALTESGKVTLVRGHVTGVHTEPQQPRASDGCARKIAGVTLARPLGGVEFVHTASFVNAAGPYAPLVHGLIRAEAGASGYGADIVGWPRPGADGDGDVPPQPILPTAGALPLVSEVHAKVILNDKLSVVPRDSPMTILVDGGPLQWHLDDISDEEMSKHAEESLRGIMGPDHAPRLTGENVGGGAHFRPFGGDASKYVLLLWEHHHSRVEAPYVPPYCPERAGLIEKSLYPELVLRRLSTVLPGLAAYYSPAESSAAQAVLDAAGLSHSDLGGVLSVDGGYYSRTPDNFPLVGPGPCPVYSSKVDDALSVADNPSANSAAFVRELRAVQAASDLPSRVTAAAQPLQGYVLCCGLSGFGVMASLAAGEVAAQHITGEAPTEWLDPSNHAAGALAPILPARSSQVSWSDTVRAGVGAGLNPMRFQSASWLSDVFDPHLMRGSGQI